MKVLDNGIEGGEEGESGFSWPDEDNAAVGWIAGAGGESGGGEAIGEACDVGIGGDHAGGDLGAGESGGRAAEDAEDVVLGGRESVGFKDRGEGVGEVAGRSLEFEEGGFGGGLHD